MKTYNILVLAVVFLVTTVTAQAQTLLEKSFRLSSTSEAVLDLTANSPGADWGMKGREAAVVTIRLDGNYHQDVILFEGAQKFTYRILLGRLAAGDHKLRVDLNATQSAPGIQAPLIHEAKIESVTAGIESLAIAHSPIIYARPDTVGRFSDVPLLAWYEVLREGKQTTLRYSIVFSNEDGGTQSSALMARWGRTTDIEWVYEVKLDEKREKLAEVFQGTSHRTLPFNGRREADHPLLIVASVNNNFSDEGQSPLRFALRPIAFDGERHAREEMMDRHPWTYRVMTAEMIREGRIVKHDSEIAGAAGLKQNIADPRRYLYLNALAAQQNAALSFAVKLKNASRWYTSDLGSNSFRIGRSGWFRTTVRLPERAGLDQIEQIIVRCDAAADPNQNKQEPQPEAVCQLNEVNKIFLLDELFQPGASLMTNAPQKMPITLHFGEMLELYRIAPCASDQAPRTSR